MTANTVVRCAGGVESSGADQSTASGATTDPAAGSSASAVPSDAGSASPSQSSEGSGGSGRGRSEAEIDGWSIDYFEGFDGSFDGQEWSRITREDIGEDITSKPMFFGVQSGAMDPNHDANRGYETVDGGVPGPLTPAVSDIQIDYVTHYVKN